MEMKGVIMITALQLSFSEFSIVKFSQKTADVWKAVVNMNKIFQALFHATKNLQVENSHRYQMSCWFATHLRKWLVLSSKIGSLELSISLTHVLSTDGIHTALISWVVQFYFEIHYTNTRWVFH